MEEGGMGMGWEGGMVDLCHVMGPNRHLVDQNKQTEKQNVSLEQGLPAGWGQLHVPASLQGAGCESVDGRLCVSVSAWAPLSLSLQQ